MEIMEFWCDLLGPTDSLELDNSSNLFIKFLNASTSVGHITQVSVEGNAEAVQSNL